MVYRLLESENYDIGNSKYENLLRTQKSLTFAKIHHSSNRLVELLIHVESTIEGTASAARYKYCNVQFIYNHTYVQIPLLFFLKIFLCAIFFSVKI